MKLDFDYSSRSYSIELVPSGAIYRASSADDSVEVEVLHREAGRLDLRIDGEHILAFVTNEGAKRWVTINGQTILLTKLSSIKKGATGVDSTPGLTAPMPGLVRVVNVQLGETVSKGQTLMVLEAMKMEFRIQAPINGRVKALHVKEGQTVNREQILIELEEAQ